MSEHMSEPSDQSAEADDERVLSVHFGRSANCSSIGSVIDVLFVSGVVGSAVLAALAVLLGGRSAEASAKSDANPSAKPPADEGSE